MPAIKRTSRALVAVVAALALALPAAAAVEFLNALDDSPIDLSPLAGEQFTEAVKSFQQTGNNPYVGNAEAVAAGKELYTTNCQVP